MVMVLTGCSAGGGGTGDPSTGGATATGAGESGATAEGPTTGGVVSASATATQGTDPTATSPVTDCNTGGELASIWSVPQGSYVSVADKGTYYPPDAVLDLHGLPISENAKICIIADMWEDDYPSADDDFGIAGMLLSFQDGWDGKHEIVTHGSGDNSVAATVNVELK